MSNTGWESRKGQRDELAKLCIGKGLDVGCGEEKIHKDAIGIDFTSAHGRKPDKFALADDLPFDDNSLDYIVSCHLLEHVADTKKVLKEWWRVLREGGTVGLSVPHGTNDSSAVYTIEHLSAFTPELLKLFLYWSGFNVIRVDNLAEGARMNIIAVGTKDRDRKPRYVVDTERYGHR